MLTHRWRRETARIVLVAFSASCVACGGSPSGDAPTTTTTVSPVATSSTLSVSDDVPEPLDAAAMRQLVAPVALYPDVVLASLLPATTYPEQLHEAAAWVEEREGVVEAVPEDRGWDGSVAGLLQFPDVVRWTDENQPWTATMGEAMTYQQGDVLSAIQDYRGDVAEAGNLESNAFQKVERVGGDIRIAPAQPDTVYVPTYDTAAATQPQPAAQGLNPWIVFGGGALVGALGAWALYSIFDDDDDDHHHHRRVKKVNNYYYYGRDRPRGDVWTPRPRARSVARRDRRRREAFEPKRMRHVYTADRAGDRRRHAGVRQPTTVPAPRPAFEQRRLPERQQRVQPQATKSKQQGPKKQGPRKQPDKVQGSKQQVNKSRPSTKQPGKKQPGKKQGQNKKKAKR